MDEREGVPSYREPLWCAVPPHTSRTHSAQDGLDTPEAGATSQRTRRGSRRAVEETGVACSEKKWLRQKRTILFVDESGFYLLPHVVRTWSRRGRRPLLQDCGSRRKEHLSAI